MKPIRLKNAKRDISAARDENGVPHLQAGEWLDALYGLGYLHALDRTTQLLFAQSVASGRGAEEISDTPELLETDRFFRRIGLYRNMDAEIAALPGHTRAEMQAYCDGVNDGVAGVGRSLPMWATGFQARPWDESAILLVGQLLSFGGLAVSQMQNERLLVELIHAGVYKEGLQEMFAPRLDDVDFELLKKVKIASQLSNDALELLTDLPRIAGSNAWAVSGQRSATGAPLLASDPHLEINRLPAIWYEAVLRWGNDGEYVMGASLPGCPLFAVARTPRLGWGVTYMKGDTVDFFIEDCRLTQSNRWQYRRGDEWLDFRIREEIIHRKGDSREKLLVYENDQGVMEGNLKDLGEGYQLSVAWSGSYPGSGAALGSWLDVVHAENTIQGMDIVRDCPQPTLCWVFADKNGRIGLQGCGRIPKRGGGQTGLTPIPAWNAENHWQGWLPQSVLPRIYDPPEGFIATANEEQNPPGGPLVITQTLPGYRKLRIVERLAELPQATIEDMQLLQYDIVSVQARELLKVFLPHIPDGDLKTTLANWDYSYSPQSTEAALFQRLYVGVMVEVFGHEEGIGWSRMLYLCSRAGFSAMMIAGTDRIMQKETSSWWRKRNKADLIRTAAAKITNADAVPWSQVNNFHFADRFFGNHQVGRMLGFTSRQYPMQGNHATPFQGHVLQTAKRESTFAPSYHLVTDLSTDIAYTNIPGGPSESRFSRYYKIDVPRWFAGEYKKLHGKPPT